MNMNNLMAQAQKMQKDIEAKQNQIYGTEYTGTSELIDITLMGDKSIKSVNIKTKSLTEDDIEILEDMIKIAYNDAFNKIEKDVEAKLGMYGKKMGGLF